MVLIGQMAAVLREMDAKEASLKRIGAALRAKLSVPAEVPPQMQALVLRMAHQETQPLCVAHRPKT